MAKINFTALDPRNLKIKKKLTETSFKDLSLIFKEHVVNVLFISWRKKNGKLQINFMKLNTMINVIPQKNCFGGCTYGVLH